MFTRIGDTIFKAYHEIDNHVEERNRGILLMLLILNMKQKKDIILILIVRTSTICKKYVNRAVQMEGAISVVLLMMVHKYNKRTYYFS